MKLSLTLLMALLFPMIGSAVEAGRLVCNEPVFDFGRVEQSAVITNVFTVRNVGDLTFSLRSVRTSCSCTKARAGKKIIAPGETAEVTVVFRARGRRGSIKKKVYLLAMESREGPALVLQVEGFVKVPGRVQ